MADESTPLGYESNQAQMPPRVICSKCGTRMLRGVIVSGIYRRSSYSTDTQANYWVEGEPTRGWLGFWRLPTGQRYEIATYRCPQCGCLESYSPAG